MLYTVTVVQHCVALHVPCCIIMSFTVLYLILLNRIRPLVYIFSSFIGLFFKKSYLVPCMSECFMLCYG